MALNLTSKQPFTASVLEMGTFSAAEMRAEYLVFLPEGANEAQIALNIASGGGEDFVSGWAQRIRTCENDQQAAKLLAAYSMTLSETMMNRAIDSMSDLLGIPRLTNE